MGTRSNQNLERRKGGFTANERGDLRAFVVASQAQMWFHDRRAETEDTGARKGGGKGSKINPKEKADDDPTEAARRW
jgi:hypothetical protein